MEVELPGVHLRLEPILSEDKLFMELTDVVTHSLRRQQREDMQMEPGYKPTSPSEYEPKNHNVTWKDIGGLYKQKEELSLAVDRFLHPEKLAFFGRNPSEVGGYLVTGPTGCGKSMLAKAAAAQLKKELGDKIKIYFPSYAQITSVLRGGEAKGIHDLFNTARKDIENGYKVMVFLDEFQSLSQRHPLATNQDEALEQMLLELDRFDYKNALFMAGSAQPLSSFDPQMIRPGRFGSIIEVTIPNAEESRDIVKIAVKTRRNRAIKGNNPHLFEEEGLEYDRIIKETEGFPSTHLVGLIDDAIKRKEKAHLHTNRFIPVTTEYILKGVQQRKNLLKKSAKKYSHLIAAQPVYQK